VETPDLTEAKRVLVGLGLDDVTPDGRGLTAPLDGVAPEDVCAALVRAGVRVRGFGTEVGTLEEGFVALTGEGFDVGE
jgi:ABC-2 type transport system ATP-binding protein